MNYFAIFDASGNIVGHFIEGINSIPREAQKMTKEEWEMSCQGLLMRDTKNKKWIKKTEAKKINPLNFIKEQKKIQIEEWRDVAIASGVNYNGYIFDSDPVSIANLNDTLTVINCGMELPSLFVWRTKDNLNVPMSEENLKELANTFFIHKNQCYTKSWQLKELVDKCRTTNEINNIKW